MAATEPIAGKQFRDALRAARQVAPVAESRLVRLLANRRSPSRLLKAFALQVHHGALEFPGLLAALIEHAPDPAAKAVLMENLLEEQGLQLVPGKGLVPKPEACHSQWSARFLRACGGDPDASELHAGRSGSETTHKLLSDDRWLEAVAYLLIGQEATFGEFAAELGAALRERGFADDDVVFFSRHAVADQAHGEQALDLVVTRAHSLAQQRATLEAAALGARHWRSQY